MASSGGDSSTTQGASDASASNNSATPNPDSGEEGSCPTTFQKHASWEDEAYTQNTIDSWKFDEQQLAHFRKLQLNLNDIKHWKNNPNDVARFLVEHDFDLKQAEQFFRNMVKWRLATNMDTFLERYGEPPPIFYSHVPMFLLKGLDHDGDAIQVQRIGKADPWGMYQACGPDAMENALHFLDEIITARTHGIQKGWQWQTEYYEPLTGRQATQFTIIVDLQGLSMRQVRPVLLGMLRKAARNGQDHYPGLAKRVLIIRPPRILSMVWRLVQHFYDERNQDKLMFVTQEDYLSVLKQYMDLSVLPSVIYPFGEGEAMPGMFAKMSMHGGVVSSTEEDCQQSASLKK